jgi:hypothetical protein
MERILISFFMLCILIGAGSFAAWSPITEDLTNWQNARFAHARDATSFKFGAAADPHYIVYPPGVGGWKKTNWEWARHYCGFGVICGDMQFGDDITIDSDIPKYSLTSEGDYPWDDMLMPPGPRPNIPKVLCMGNHEVDGAQTKKMWTDLYHPGAVQSSSWGSDPDDDAVYFSFNYGNWHFICLDHWRASTIPVSQYKGGKLDDAEVEWLIADLHAHRGRTTAMFMHPPIEGNAEWQMSTEERNRLGSIVARFPDVQWMFFGHIHSYRKQKWGEVNAIVTSFFSGAGIVTVTPGEVYWSRFHDGATGFYCWDAYGGYSAGACGNEAVRDDAFTSAGSLPSPYTLPDKPTPGAPGGLSKNSSTDSSLTLQWTAATNADYYVIHRDGDSVGVSLFLNFTDHGLSASTSYNYEVFARNISDKTSASAAGGNFSTAGTTVLSSGYPVNNEVPFIRVSPNPANTKTTVRVTNAALNGSQAKMSVYDLTGRLVFSNIFSNDLSMVWNTTHHGSGIYTVIVKTNEQTLKTRISIIR